MTLVVLAVAVIDQSAKALAWRTLPDVHINSGGNPFSGSTVGTLLSGRTSGAVLDIVNAALLVAATVLLVRFTVRRSVAIAAAALLSGWISNIADRLGTHYVTAPGSVRGVVDFIPFSGHYWNLADVTIVISTPLLLLALLAPTTARTTRRYVPRRAPTAWLPVAVATVLIAVSVLAVTGATYGGYLDGPQSLADAAWGRR